MVSFKKLLNVFLSPAVNIPVGIFLLGVFFIAGQNIAQTFFVANASALNYLKPNPPDYLWELNTHQALLDPNKIRNFADYYEHLLGVFPGLRDAYGLLGYCYHYLNDDPKAVRFLKKSIEVDPDYFWNYYNLAVIYINESRYREASDMLQKALTVDPKTTFKRLFTSSMVYLPLLGKVDKKVMVDVTQRLKKVRQSCFVLVRILNQADYNKKILEIMRKLNLELYAF